MWHLKDEAEKLGIELGIEGDSVLPNLNNNALIGTTLSTLFRVQPIFRAGSRELHLHS